MKITLTPEITAMIEHFMAFDGYTSEIDVIRDALTALRQELDLAAIKEGLADEKAGRLRPAREVLDEIRERFGLGDSQ